MLNWSKAELDFVIKNSPFIDDTEGARQFRMIFSKNLTPDGWRRIRNLLGIRKGTGKSSKASIIPGSPLDLAGARIEDLTHVNITTDKKGKLQWK